MCYGCYANGFPFDFYLAHFRFVLFFFAFFQTPLRCYVYGVSIVRLGLGLGYS